MGVQMRKQILTITFAMATSLNSNGNEGINETKVIKEYENFFNYLYKIERQQDLDSKECREKRRQLNYKWYEITGASSSLMNGDPGSSMPNDVPYISPIQWYKNTMDNNDIMELSEYAPKSCSKSGKIKLKDLNRLCHDSKEELSHEVKAVCDCLHFSMDTSEYGLELDGIYSYPALSDLGLTKKEKQNLSQNLLLNFAITCRENQEITNTKPRETT